MRLLHICCVKLKTANKFQSYLVHSFNDECLTVCKVVSYMINMSGLRRGLRSPSPNYLVV